jgi:hypothetical protein
MGQLFPAATTAAEPIKPMKKYGMRKERTFSKVSSLY